MAARRVATPGKAVQMGKGQRGVGLVTALAVTMVAFVAPASAASGVKKPEPPPDHWDKRIAKIATFVARDRKLDFKHPIPVEFLSDAKFRRKVRTDEKDVTAKDRREAAQAAGQLHALGLIGAGVDLIKANSSLDEASIVGYYDTEREVMVIRGKDLSDIDVRVTVAHELTHVLQDQYFNLDKLYNSTETSGGAFAIDALTEGDAVLVENDYIGSLSQKEQDEYYGQGASADQAPVDEPLPAGVPVVLDVYSTVPYVLGPAFAYLLHSIGRRELDQAYADPPVTDEDIIDPVAWVKHKHPDRVKTPKLGEGEKKAGAADEFGAFTLYLMLAARTDEKTALRAATGWGGDRYIGFERDGAQCVRAAFVGDTHRDTDEIDRGLSAWAATLPAGMATVERDRGLVVLTSCENDTVVPPEAATLEDAVYTTLNLRLTLTADFVGGFNASVSAARCSADKILLDPQLSPIVQRLYFEGVAIKKLTAEERALFYTSSGKYLTACGVKVNG